MAKYMQAGDPENHGNRMAVKNDGQRKEFVHYAHEEVEVTLEECNWGS